MSEQWPHSQIRGLAQARVLPTSNVEYEKRPSVAEVLEEARRLREQALRIRQGLGPVVNRLAAERETSRRAIRAVTDTVRGVDPEPRGAEPAPGPSLGPAAKSDE
jgi:hypothetical protein